MQSAINKGLFYNGEWNAPLSSSTYETVNPATGESLGDIANAQIEDVNQAVHSANEAFTLWSQLSPIERASYLRIAADTLLKHKEEIARLDAIDGGNPITFMMKDIDYMAECFYYYAGLAIELKGETIPGSSDRLNYTLREPLGVIAHILAFNHPALFIGWTASAALSAGNTVIIKPAEQTPLSALLIAKLFSSIFPPGVFNVLTGDRQLGPLLCDHPLVKKVIFIGSINTGKSILKQCSKTIKPATLEMGGKNALIIYPDADLDKAADIAIAGMNFAWCGQSCGSTSRVFIHSSVYSELTHKIIEKAKAISPGDPLQYSTAMGALVSQAHLNKVLHYLETGIEEGATLSLDGRYTLTNDQLKQGCFLAPCIFTNVHQSMTIAQEEIFGPIMSILKWDCEKTLLSDVNSVKYGLTGSICTTSLSTAHRVAKKITAGYIWINQAGPHFLGAPFGGQKQSGSGRLGCLQTLMDCTQLKNINIQY